MRSTISEPRPLVLAVIEWPDEDGEFPTILFGRSAPELDRAVIDYLRHSLPTAHQVEGTGARHELREFVQAVPFPAADATDEDNLRWLTDLASGIASTNVTLLRPPTNLSGEAVSITRYVDFDWELSEQSRILRLHAEAFNTPARARREKPRKNSDRA